MEGFQSKNHFNISVDPPRLLFSPSEGLEQLLIKIPGRGNLIENKKNRTAMYRLEVRSALKSGADPYRFPPFYGNRSDVS